MTPADKDPGLAVPYKLERHDQDDGSIVYEIWSVEPYYCVVQIGEFLNEHAKRDAENILALLNRPASQSPADDDLATINHVIVSSLDALTLARDILAKRAQAPEPQQSSGMADAIKALEFYANKESYYEYINSHGFRTTPIQDDFGDSARNALTSLRSQAGGGGPSEEQLSAAIKDAWKKIQPSKEAQAARAVAANSFDIAEFPQWASDYLPEYVSDFADIAVQHALNASSSPPVPSPASVEGKSLNDDDLAGFARRIANHAISDAESKDKAAVYCSHLFRSSIEEWALAILKSAVQHEQMLGKSAHAAGMSEGMRSAAEELFNSIKWSVALNHEPPPDAKGKLSRKVIPIIQTALDNAMSEGRARGLEGFGVDRYRKDDGSGITIEWRGLDKWAVCNGGNVLNKSGEWEYEPLPSSRDDAFMERTRFKSPDEAILALTPTGKEGT